MRRWASSPLLQEPSLAQLVTGGHLAQLRRRLRPRWRRWRGQLDTRQPHTGRTLVHLAVLAGEERLAELRLLLDKGARPGLADTGGWTPLHHAASLGHREAVSELLSRGLEAGLDTRTRDSQASTALHLAVRGGRAEVVTSLLEAGASWRLPDARGWSCLQLAVVRGAADCVTALLHHGAPGAASHCTPRCSWPPLHLAVVTGRPDLVSLLINRGADSSARHLGRTALEVARAQEGGERIASVILEAEWRRGEVRRCQYIISVYLSAPRPQVRLPTPPPTPGSVARAATLDRWRWRLEHLQLDSEDSEGEETAEEVNQLHHSDHDQEEKQIIEQNKPSWKKCDFKHTSDLKSKGREIGADMMTPSSVDVGVANVANYKEMRSALLQQLDQIKLKHKEKVSNEIEEKKKSYNQALER